MYPFISYQASNATQREERLSSSHHVIHVKGKKGLQHWKYLSYLPSPSLFGSNYGLINYIDTKAICRHLKILTCIGTLRQALSIWDALASHVLCGVVRHFVGSESGQIQCVKLLQNMVSTPLTPPPPQPHTVRIYCTLTKGRGTVKPEKRLEGQPCWVKNTNLTDCISSL